VVSLTLPGDSRKGEIVVGRDGTELIDLRDAEVVRARRPLLIAHRGGAVGLDAPENSLAAIRRAAEHGYDMVELDVVCPKDGEPVLFHDRTGNLLTNCGIDASVADLTAPEPCTIRYRASDQHVPTLAQALALCRRLELGVMLDIKAEDEWPRIRPFADRIGALLDRHALTRATLSLSHLPLVQEALDGRALFPIREDDLRRVGRDQAMRLHGRFWFGIPEALPYALVPKLQINGALVIPAINTSRYPPHAHAALAREDIGRLLAIGVDGLQIDSVYRDFLSGG